MYLNYHSAKHLCITLVILIFSNVVASQNPPNDDLAKKYSAYFELPRQTTHLHLNKSSFIQDEEIWFKAYFYDRQREKPSSDQTALHIDIVNPNGTVLKSEKFAVHNGLAHGNILIDSLMTSGTYYLRASTLWMDNFKEDDSFTQKITVVSNDYSGDDIIQKKAYDIQLLPEGGHLIHSTSNTVGVKVVDQNGYGATFKDGVVRDQNGVNILKIESKPYGFAKFDIIPSPSQIYTAHFTFKDGSIIDIPLPETTTNIPGLAIIEENQDKIVVQVKSNWELRNNIDREGLYVLIHRNGIAKKIKTPLTKEANLAEYVVNKELLFQGVNIVTLFDVNDQPLSERLYFNWNSKQDINLDVTQELTSNRDSLQITLRNTSNNHLKKNLSISILPSETIAHQTSSNIYSSFFLKPYVSGFIENPKQYFNDGQVNKEQLDLLLLTQGWSRYSWDDIINNTPQQKFNSEQGITLVGRLNITPEADQKIYVHPTNTSQGSTLELTDGVFALGGLYPKTGQQFAFSLLDENGGLSRPGMFVYEKSDRVLPDNISFQGPSIISEELTDIVEKTTIPFVYTNNEIALNEVIISFEKDQEEIRGNPFVPTYLKNKIKVVTQDESEIFPFVTDIIRQNGFIVREELSFGSTSRISIINRRVSSFSGPRAPLVYLDDVQLLDLDILYGLRTDFIESYFINKFDSRSGSRGGNGVIRLYSRRDFNVDFPSLNPRKKKSYEKKAFTYTIRDGFSIPKKFYNPQYSVLNSTAFINYGTIHWEPSVILENNNKTSFNIINTNTKSITLFIEGMSEDGEVISKIKELKQLPINN